jgi:L-cysteine/cystine lyase
MTSANDDAQAPPKPVNSASQRVTEDGWHLPFRARLPVLKDFVYLNTGTAGPIPQVAADAMAAEANAELLAGRGNFATWDRFFLRLDHCRQLAARAMGALPDEICLTHHTSEGINIVLWGMDWQAGDVVVSTSLEHDAICVPMGLLKQRRGVELAFAEIGLGERERCLEGIRETLDAAGGKAKLLLLSHVAYNSGALLPLAEIVELAHARGVPVLVDGAQTCGVMPLDVHALGVDYYTLSGQKWMLGPEGTGALYVAKERLESIAPTFTSYFSPAHHDFRGEIEWQPTPRRFETGMVHRPSWAAFEASAEWLLDEVGLERAWERSVALTQAARTRLEQIGELEIITPAPQQTPLLSFDLPSYSPQQLWALCMDLAARDQLILRSTPHAPYCARVTFGFFNDEREIERLAKGLEGAIARGPEALEITGYAERLATSR